MNTGSHRVIRLCQFPEAHMTRFILLAVAIGGLAGITWLAGTAWLIGTP